MSDSALGRKRTGCFDIVSVLLCVGSLLEGNRAVKVGGLYDTHGFFGLCSQG